MIPPVVTRELTAAVRHPGFNRDRWRIGLAGLLLFAVAVIVAQFEGRASAGMSIFHLLAWLLWVCCIFLGSAMTADTLSRERREGTLGLLFLTPLNAWDVVIGKLTSGATTALYRLLTLTPMLTCCLLLGGILGSDVLTVVAICLNTLFLSLALGIFISSTQTDDRTSFSLTFTVFMGLSVLPYGLDACLPAVLIRGFGAESAYLILSPAYPLKILASPVWMGGLKVVPVASAVLLQHVVAWMLLGMTASRLRHVALNRPPSAVGKLWDRWRQRWLYGSARSREASRRQLLAIHPIVWLGLRHRRKQPYVWLMFGLLAAVTGAMASYLNDQSSTPDFLIGYFFFGLAMLKIWVISETCTRLVEDRRSGALELLLTTPTSALAWIYGQAAALKRLFLLPVTIAGGLVLVVLYWQFGDGIDSDSFQRTIMAVLVVGGVTLMDLPTLFWRSLWESLSGNSVNAAASRVVKGVLFPAYVLAFLSYLIFLWLQATWTGSVPAPKPFHWWLGWLLLNGVIDWLVLRAARRRVLGRFREIVAEGPSALEPESPSRSPMGRPRGFRPTARIWGWILCHPVVAMVLLVGLAVSIFIWVRNEIWDHRAAIALERLWLPGIPRELPSASTLHAVNSPTTAALVQSVFDATRSLQSQALIFSSIDNPYLATNWAQVSARIQRFVPITDLFLKLPDDAHFAWPSPALDQWGNQPFQSGPISAATLVLSIRMQRAIEAGEPDEAIRCFQALCRVSRLLGECPSPIFSEGRTEVARQVIDSLKRWLNTKSEARPNLTVISNELAQADSWTSANRRLRLLPAVLARNYQQPGAFSGTDLMLARALDLLTTGRRQDSVEAFLQVGEILPTLNLTETQRLDRILAISNRHFNPQPIGTISPLFLNRGTFQTYLNDAHTIAQIRLARAAVLVEEFRRKEGRIPWTETEISEANFGTWPAEPFSGKPYKLVRTSHGYRIEFAAPVPRILTPRKRLLIGAKEEANVFEVHASP